VVCLCVLGLNWIRTICQYARSAELHSFAVDQREPPASHKTAVQLSYQDTSFYNSNQATSSVCHTTVTVHRITFGALVLTLTMLLRLIQGGPKSKPLSRIIIKSY